MREEDVMPDEKEDQAAEAKETSSEDEPQPDEPVAEDKDEDDVEGHITQADLWPRSPNTWRRRR